MIFLDESSYQLLGILNPRVIFLLCLRQLKFGKVSILHLFNLQEGACAAQFGIGKNAEVVGGIRHQPDVLQEPVVVVDSDSTGMIKSAATCDQPVIIVADRLESGCDVGSQIRLIFTRPLQ